MKKCQLSLLMVLVTGTLVSSSAYAGEFALGGGIIGENSVYKGDDTHVYPFPFFSYESENFYFHGLGGGYYLWNDEQNKLSLTASYFPFGFKPSDSSDAQVQKLDRRRSTLMAGIAYRHDEDWGTIRTSLVGDTLDNSNGLTGDIAYLYRFNMDDWSMTPSVGVTWDSKNQNRYYYGVSDSESARSGLSSYNPNDSWSPYVELLANYKISQKWNAWVTSRYTHLANEVKNSPIVDKNYSLLFGAGVSYTF
ncbi:MipA/OmpV family protein [Pectobacteriaceae bacterium CE90]|nr:MipA/OmpV family protein [Pectobacteriaceae bacterium CE90]